MYILEGECLLLPQHWHGGQNVQGGQQVSLDNSLMVDEKVSVPLTDVDAGLENLGSGCLLNEVDLIDAAVAVSERQLELK